MSLLKNIFLKIEHIGQWGTTQVKDYSDLKRIKITNYSLLIAIFKILTFSLLYATVDFWALLPVIININMFLLVYLLALFINKKEYHLSAKILLHAGIFVPVFINTAILSGSNPGNHFYFLVFALLPVLYWSLKDFGYVLFFFAINICSFLYIEFFTINEIFPVLYPESSIFYFRIITITFSFLTIALGIFVYQNQAENSEKLLKKQSKNLKVVNSRLQQTNEEIIVQKEQIEKQRNELQQAYETRDKFFSIIAHDLISPFNALLGFSEILLLKNKEYDAEKRKELIKVIYDTADQTLNLLNNLLIWSKIETGQIHFNPLNIIIDEVIEETVLLLKNVASKKNIEIKCEIEKSSIRFC